MKPLTELLPEVLMHVNGCPVPIVLNAIRNSVSELLTHSGLLEKTIEIELRDTTNSYPVTMPAGYLAVTFKEGRIGSHIVKPENEINLSAYGDDWETQTGSLPVVACFKKPLLLVVPMPSEIMAMQATFYSTLSREATECDDFIIEDWAEGIAHGALARLMILPGYKWTSGDLATYHKALFDNCKSSAAAVAMQSATNAPVMVRHVRFG